MAYQIKINWNEIASEESLRACLNRSSLDYFQHRSAFCDPTKNMPEKGPKTRGYHNQPKPDTSFSFSISRECCSEKNFQLRKTLVMKFLFQISHMLINAIFSALIPKNSSLLYTHVQQPRWCFVIKLSSFSSFLFSLLNYFAAYVSICDWLQTT